MNFISSFIILEQCKKEKKKKKFQSKKKLSKFIVVLIVHASVAWMCVFLLNFMESINCKKLRQ